MEKLDKELIEKLSKDLMFRLTDEEIEMIHSESSLFLNQVKVLHDINTDGIEVMSYPFETATSWLREDESNHVIGQSLALKNAPRVEGDYFEIVKVVNK